MRVPSSRAAVITGCGAVSPFGCGVAALWQGLLSGANALRSIRAFEAARARAGEVPGYDGERDLGAAAVRRLRAASVVMVQGLCYSGNIVSLVFSRRR